jgi:glycerophosphoryl diester phosphodiesterase
VVRHSLLHHAAEVEALRRRSSRVGVWTVDDVDRALELASWGVDEITSNSLSVLAAL